MKILLVPDPSSPNGQDAFCREIMKRALARGHEVETKAVAQPSAAEALAALRADPFAASAEVALINGPQPEALEAAKSLGAKIALRLIDVPAGSVSESRVRDMALKAERLLLPSRHLASLAERWGCNGAIRQVPFAYDRIMAGQISLVTLRAGRPSSFPLVACAALDEANQPGIEALLAALSRLRLDCHLSIIGAGPLREHFQNRARDLQVAERVSFLGNLEHSRVQEYLRAAKAYIDSCGSEGFPVWALYALAEGCPVIAVDKGALPELIRHGQNGFLVPPANASALAEAISTLHAVRGLSLKIIAEGVKTVECHNWDATVEAALSAIEELR